MSMSRVPTAVSGAVAGALCGLLAARVYTSFPQHTASTPAATSSEESTREPPRVIQIPVPQPAVDLTSVEARLARLESANSRLSSVAPTPPEERPTGEEATARGEAAAIGRLRDHDQEPMDVAWATRTTGGFETDLQRIGHDQSLQVERVDCRSRTCLAFVQWPRYQDAQRSMSALLHADFAANCTRTVFFPPPDPSAQGSYRARIDFNCTETRSEQAGSQ